MSPTPKQRVATSAGILLALAAAAAAQDPVRVYVQYAFRSNSFPGPLEPNSVIPLQVGKAPIGRYRGDLRHYTTDPRWPGHSGFWGISGSNKYACIEYTVFNTEDENQKKSVTIKASVKTNDGYSSGNGLAVTVKGSGGSAQTLPNGNPPACPGCGAYQMTWQVDLVPQPKQETVRIEIKTGAHADNYIFIDDLEIETICSPKDPPPQEPGAPPDHKDKGQSHYHYFHTPVWPPEPDYSVLPTWYGQTLWERGGSSLPEWLPGVTDHIGVLGLPGGAPGDGLLSVRLDDQPEAAGQEYVAYQFDFFAGAGSQLLWTPLVPPECTIEAYDEQIEPLEHGWQRAYLRYRIVPPPAWQELRWMMHTEPGGEPVAIDHLVMSGSTWWAEAWYDSFGLYEVGAGLHGQDGWKGWDNNPTFDGAVTDQHAYSLFNAVEVAGPTDLVHEFTDLDWGRYAVTVWQYVPADFQSHCDPHNNCGSYFLLLNTYADGGPYHWSVQLHADSLTGAFIRDGRTPAALPLITDRWVRIEVVVDLHADSYRVYYDGMELGAPESWSAGVMGGGGGALNIAAVDLYANQSTPVFYDDVYLRPVTPGDLNGDGKVNFNDINPFVQLLSDPAAWLAAQPNCALANGDTNFDGRVDFGDINPFVALLTGR